MVTGNTAAKGTIPAGATKVTSEAEAIAKLKSEIAKTKASAEVKETPEQELARLRKELAEAKAALKAEPETIEYTAQIVFKSNGKTVVFDLEIGEPSKGGKETIHPKAGYKALPEYGKFYIEPEELRKSFSKAK